MANLYYFNIFKDRIYKIDEFYKNNAANGMIFETILDYYYKIIHEKWYGNIEEIALEKDTSVYPQEISKMYYIKTSEKYVFVFIICDEDFVNEYNKKMSDCSNKWSKLWQSLWFFIGEKYGKLILLW